MTQRRIYQNKYPYFVTFKTKESVPIFEKTEYANLLSLIIFKSGNLKQYNILSFQIMPDHVHLLVNSIKNMSATTESCARRRIISNPALVSAPALDDSENFNISQLMHTIKSYFVNELRNKHNVSRSMWQRRFYTRVIDTDEYFKNVIQYIKQNPIKASLPSKYHKPPYQLFDWEKVYNLFE